MNHTKKKIRISELYDSIFLIIIGVVFFMTTRSPEAKNIENTTKINGVLSESPKSGVHDESEDFIRVNLAGYGDYYEFTKCSLNAYIEQNVENLQVGDSITLYLDKSNSSTIYPSFGKSYNVYKVCAAKSPKHGTYLDFASYNACKVKKANILYPLICGALILIAVGQLIHKINDKDSYFSPKYLNLEDQSDIYYQLRPHKITYLSNHLKWPIISIVAGVATLVFDILPTPYMSYAFIAGGIYFIYHYLRISSKIYYVLDQEGVHIKNVTVFFQEEVKTINYNSIKEVLYKPQDFSGTVLIYTGRKDDDGDKVYDKLIGIDNYMEVVDFIKKLIIRDNPYWNA
ncbi:hypothetical protein [Fulvivirga ligni]|uniref:hypothetical protein n=1 Tax=Fulvivirga ligni TaxID=2904246 RepID=UPI001F3D9789|nr:hypothetical protein [Fulvivirga ligni]UII19113.1 hypothetical protein LVD16_14810 [Fulvivirga ligni]